MNFFGRLLFLILGGLLLISGCQNSQTSSGVLGNSTNGSTVPPGRTQLIQATASDPAGVTKVEFYVNGTLTCTITSSPYNCSWQVPVGAGVQYQLQTIAYDTKGLQGSSQVINVTSQ